MEFEAQLKREVAEYRAATYAESTKKSYATHLKRYFEFCAIIGRPPVPATQETIAQYAAYLARDIKATSIRQYLNIIRLLHVEAGFKNPLHENWYIKSTLTGIERLLGEPAVRRTPINPVILMCLHPQLEDTVVDRMFWAGALIMFYGLLRKSNLFPESTTSFDPAKQFTRSDFVQNQDGSISVNVKYSKTNQFHRRKFEFKLLPINHVLSPTAALHRAFQGAVLPPNASAFVSSSGGTPMTGREFNAKLKVLIGAAGLDPVGYSSHSFRRGGACWALQCGIPGEVVQIK